MRRVMLVFIAVGLLGFAASPAAAQSIQYGKWEITTKMEMPGMPMEMPAVTQTQCITEENMAPQPDQPGQECQTTYDVDGNTVHYTVVCDTPDGKMEGEGTSTFTDDAMTGSMHMVMHGEDGMEMSQEYSGRYLGPCEE